MNFGLNSNSKLHYEPLRPNRYFGIPDKYEFVHGENSICVYDINTLEFIKEIPVGENPDCHATTCSNKYLYIATLDGVYIIDQEILEVVKILDVGKTYATNTLPDGNTIFIHDNYGGILVLKDVDDMDKVHVHKRLDIIPHNPENIYGTMLGGKGYFLEGDRYYVCAGWDSGMVYIIDTENDYEWEEFIPHHPVLLRGDDLVMTKDRKYAFIACHRGYDEALVTVIDLEKRCIIKTVPTGHGTCGLTMTNDERYVIASNDKDDTISVIDTLTQSVCNTVSARKAFNDLGYETGYIQGITVGVNNEIYVYECHNTGALVRFTSVAENGKATVACKGKIAEC